ncbi:MAG: glutamate synthase-related protein [Clostridiaceae bacterium]|nr:glutamate synthase-related protein [Clostridiaceae bacterium]
MSYSPRLSTTFNETKLRTEHNICELSGMCSVCSDKCTGMCEVGLSAVRGLEAAYPINTATQQFASEKNYPFDYSHFNINGRVFGASGAEGDEELVNVYSADLSCTIGSEKKIALKAPIILPAMAKLNWRDYYAGAAMAGILVVIGENAVKNDPELAHDEYGKVSNSPLLEEMIGCFRKYDKGFGDIVLQVNADDIAVGTPEYALKALDLKTLEIKFGQAAKGIQHVAPVYSYNEALKIKNNGYLILPDPMDKKVIEAIEAGERVHFMQYGRLPMWDETKLADMISRYRALGAENIFFKMAGYDVKDIKRVLKIASDNKVALVTFDGAGGGTGHSPCKMMNEWSYPTIELELIVHSIMSELEKAGAWLPSIAIAGGIVFEDTVFKALSLGAPYVKLAAIGRGAMAAAMSGKKVGEMIEKGIVPEMYKSFEHSGEPIFLEEEALRKIYKDTEGQISAGSIGLYSFIQRVSWGMKLLMTLNRKFKLELLDQSDVIPLTKEARDYINTIGI